MTDGAFRSAGYDWRLFCGPGVLEAHLPAVVARARAERAFVVCSPSVHRRTNLTARIQAALGARCVGVFDGIEKDSTYASVAAARDAAKAANADLLLAVGGGSVIVAVRAVAIFMAEAGDPFEIMTQYPPDGRPYSPRLNAPKPPIVNIPTTPTSAMNRAGTGLKNPDLDHRMEYFDPKTRPAAIILDDDALLTAPASLALSTATTVFAGVVGALSSWPDNPLVEGDQNQAARLAHGAYLSLPGALDDPRLRRDLSLAAFLQNRAEDDGRAMRSRGALASDYALATALHLRYPNIGQGESTSVFHGATIRRATGVEAALVRRVADLLDVRSEGLDAAAMQEAIAARLEAVYTAAGMPIRLRDLEVAREDFAAIAGETVKNFNASATLSSPEARIAGSMALLETAW